MTPLRIALVAQGRFHVFDLARELIRLGHVVTLLTNHPYRSCERFGLPRAGVRTFAAHRYLYRSLGRLVSSRLREQLERAELKSFGRWAAGVLAGEAGRYDVIASMSVSGPSFRLPEEQVEEVVRRVVAAAVEVSHRLGWGHR